MDRDYILEVVQREAAQNGGKPLGQKRLRAVGVRPSDWGNYWARIGDLNREAGLEPNRLNSARVDEDLLDRVVGLTGRLGRFPAFRELHVAASGEDGFPATRTLRTHFGGMQSLRERLRVFCQERGLDDVAGLCEPIEAKEKRSASLSPRPSGESLGFVYLFKSGRVYKIGRSNAVGRRAYELAIQLPEKLTLVHSIQTGDPVRTEKYWHERFEERRKNGEWFELTAADVSTFRRCTFM